MASLFVPPSKPKTPKTPPDYTKAEQAKARINAARRKSSGSYSDTIVGSGLKTSLGQ